MTDRPPTYAEVMNTPEEISQAEIRSNRESRVQQIVTMLDEMRNNPAVETYLEIKGQEICSPKAFKVNRYMLMVLLLLVEKVGTMTRACQLLHLSHQTISETKNKYPAFHNALELAALRYNGMLVDVATDLAVNGWQEEVYGKAPGKDAGIIQVGTKTKRDPRLLETMMSANMKKFRKAAPEAIQAQKVEIVLNFGDGSGQEVIDGTTGEIITDQSTPQLGSPRVSEERLESHDPGFEGIKESEL